MGNSEEEKSSKPEKSSSPATDHNNIHHVYPDWAAMQAYYGPRLAVPPYMNSAVASPHAPPPYMWGPPQSMIPPYGAPYAAFYPHGGMYPHPGIPMAGPGMSMETSVKSSGNADGGFVKKLKEFDGLAMSIGNGNGHIAEHGTDHRTPESGETEGSSDGSNGVTTGAVKNRNKRSQQDSSNSADGKAQKMNRSTPAVEVGRTSEKSMDMITPANVPVKTMENKNTALVLKDPSDVNVKSSPTNTSQPSAPNELWLQNERELKREKRKQSNRESARRSRLRKQAESEDLGAKVQTLVAENTTLKSEIKKLMECSEKLRLGNAALLEKLNEARLGHTEKVSLHKIDDVRLKPIGTVNLLERVNNSGITTDSTVEDGDSIENRSSGAKLQLHLDASPRTDAVAAR